MLWFLVLALYVPYNMIDSPLCVITCLASFVLASCLLVWFPCFCLLICIFAYVHACAFACLFVSSSIAPTYDFLRVHAPFCTRNLDPHLGALLDGICVVHTPI